MLSIKTILPSVLVLSFLAFFSCSNAQKEYEEVQKIQDATEQVMQRSIDYDVRLKSCADVINSLNTFLEKHPEGEWSNVAKTALAAWQSRKDDLQRERNSLSNQLYSRLKEKAIEEASKAHGMSKIEEINLQNRHETKDGLDIIVKDTYSIRMRGMLLGMHIFKLNVITSGRISADTKKIFVDEKAIIQE